MEEQRSHYITKCIQCQWKHTIRSIQNSKGYSNKTTFILQVKNPILRSHDLENGSGT
jgi:hypothetical protein